MHADLRELDPETLRSRIGVLFQDYASYELSVREARTGKTLAETTVEATSTDCPMFMNFDGTSDTVDGYASPADSAVTEFLRPHMTASS